MKKNIYVMTKAPFRGIIKNRLSSEIGYVKSHRLTCNNIEKIERLFLRREKEYSVNWYLTPYYQFRSYSFSFSKKCVLQNKGDLGRKIWNILAIQNNSFIIVGTDIPKINLIAISLSFKLLKTNNVVIGPTYDGGFWLIGFSNKRKIVYPFNKVRWSSQNTLKDLIKNLKKNNISYSFTKKLRDIDNKDDYCKNNKD